MKEREPDGGLAGWIEVLEDTRETEGNAQLLLLLIELRRHRTAMAERRVVEPCAYMWRDGPGNRRFGVNKPQPKPWITNVTGLADVRTISAAALPKELVDLARTVRLDAHESEEGMALSIGVLRLAGER
jgi:hypothetical protein